jgi:hypothetical protein
MTTRAPAAPPLDPPLAAHAQNQAASYYSINSAKGRCVRYRLRPAYLPPDPDEPDGVCGG